MQRLSLNSEIFTRAVEDIVTRDELVRLLSGKKKLRVKLGIDATAPELHIGHAANLWKIRALQERGHKAVIVLGDTTTQIGDPTGRSKMRPVLSPKEIESNIRAIRKQVERILSAKKSKYEVRRNSEWYKKMNVEEFMHLVSLVTHARLIERDMFQERIKKGEEIAASELLYPILQGYDSVAIRSDMTVIGSDQLFNEHMGRRLQEKFGHHPQVIMTLKLLPGLDGGEKMSKSQGNYIGLADTPRDKFGKAMRVPDSLIISYMESYTDIPFEQVRSYKKSIDAGRNPMNVKLVFAEAIVRRYHGARVAIKERKEFLRVFSKRGPPENIPAVRIKHGMWNPADLLVACRLVSSRTEARRLIIQRGVAVDDVIIEKVGEAVQISVGAVVRVGRRKFVKIS